MDPVRATPPRLPPPSTETVVAPTMAVAGVSWVKATATITRAVLPRLGAVLRVTVPPVPPRLPTRAPFQNAGAPKPGCETPPRPPAASHASDAASDTVLADGAVRQAAAERAVTGDIP